MTVSPLIGPIAAPGLHVMTFNIRRRMGNLNPRSPDKWSRREPLVRQLLDNEQPAIVGVQEAMPEQLDAVQAGLGSNYRHVGRGRRADGTGESCPLYYDADRLELLHWEQLALSDTPHKPGSTSWGNMVPRMLVRASFRDGSTGAEFLVVNTHLDHRSRRSRLRSAGAIRNLVGASRLPAVVLGDFNTDAGTKPYLALTDGGGLLDTWKTASENITPEWGTYPHYRAPTLHRKRIDWVLASPGFTVQRVGINVTMYDGGWPSDHTPVQAVLSLASTGDWSGGT